MDLQSKLRGEEATKQDLSEKLAEVRMMRGADSDVREVKSMSFGHMSCSIILPIHLNRRSPAFYFPFCLNVRLTFRTSSHSIFSLIRLPVGHKT